MKKKKLFSILKTSDTLSKVLLSILLAFAFDAMAQKAATFPTFPYLSEHTQYMTVSDTYTKCVYNVSEGMFCVKDNGKIGTWSIDGDLKHAPKWKEFGLSYNNPMHFDHGALLVLSAERNAQGKEYYAILYKDCRIKNLNPTWEPKTPFVDGLAIVQKKEGYSIKETFFMDVNGERLPSPAGLTATYGRDIRPMRCGLRAFKSNKKWGFVDENLKVVIDPKWDEARNFSEDYAWVFEKDKDSFFNQYKASLIDAKGNVVCEIPSIAINSNILTSNALGDVHDGRYYVSEKDDEVTYYKLPNTKIGSAERASSFHNGVALIGTQQDTHGYVIAVDKDFKYLATYPTYSSDNQHYISHSDLNASNLFESSDFASIETGSKVIDYQGRLIIEAYDKEFGDNRVTGFGEFGKDGYAVMDNITINTKHCLALVKTNGEIAWLFSKEKLTKEELQKIPHNKNWEKGTIAYTDSKVQPCMKKAANGANGGTPNSNIVEESLYKVTVVCHPNNGGKANVPGPNRVKYGTKKEIVVTPNEGWYCSKIEVNKKVTKDKTFEVTDDVVVDVYFKQKETAQKNIGNIFFTIDIDTHTHCGGVPPTTQTKKPQHQEDKKHHTTTDSLSTTINDDLPPTIDSVHQVIRDSISVVADSTHIRTYQGTMPFDVFKTKEPRDFDVYAEICDIPNISSPFGDKTYGYVALMIDPKTYYTSKEFSTYLFVTPFKIVGCQRDPLNKTYLILDGGSIAYYKIKSIGAGLLSLWLNTVFVISDWTSPVGEARRYRLEIKDINANTGEFTMGRLETFTPEYGWLPGGDKRASKIKPTKTYHYHDNGFDKDQLNGCRMRLAPKRNDIIWYPPMEWYGNDKSKYEEVIGRMKTAYKDYGSDYNSYFIWR